MRRTMAGAAAVAACAAGGAVASGSIPDGKGVISACYRTADGGLRVIDRASDAVCRKEESELVWSQRGPQGPAGTGSATAGVNHSGEQAALELESGGGWQTIAQRAFTAGHDGVLTFAGAVEQLNLGKAPASVELRILHNGHAHDIPSQSTVEPGLPGTGTVSFVCNGHGGPNDVELQARATSANPLEKPSVRIGDRSFSVTLANRMGGI